MKSIKDIIKFENDEEYNKFLDDYSKYKKALYSFYEESNDKFPFEDFSCKEDIIQIVFLKEYDYSHDIILKVLDEILMPKLNLINKTLILYFLFGLNAISEIEFKEREEVLKIIDNNEKN